MYYFIKNIFISFIKLKLKYIKIIIIEKIIDYIYIRSKIIKN